MTPTEISLLAIHRSPTVRLDEICDKYLNVNVRQARQLAARNALGLPTFRLSPSQKAPVMVSIVELAKFIDAKANAARDSWETSQV